VKRAGQVGEPCPRCGTGIQRTPKGTQLDGLREHYGVVHPEVPIVNADKEVKGLGVIDDE
jgi:hypothetical protein